MARFALVAFCVAAALAPGAKTAKAVSLLDLGIIMTTRSYDAVCWFENLKVFPETYSKHYLGCQDGAKNIQRQMDNPSEQNKKYFDMYPDQKASTYGQFLDSMAMSSIPSEYKTKCGKYLKNSAAAPQADESDALNDNNSGIEYPFKGLAYCMMTVLRQKHGDGAIESVKNEMTHQYKNWMQTLLDRDNEFRARHGSPPLELVKDLNSAAQAWADENARECNSHHTDNADPSRQFNGDGTGESIAAGGGEDNSRAAAYSASDGWYEENKNYPYPAYTGNNNDAQFFKIGHFTQSVWKGSKYVGYGYAYNKDCPITKYYMAARYSPAGNMPGEYKNNVGLPK